VLFFTFSVTAQVRVSRTPGRAQAAGNQATVEGERHGFAVVRRPDRLHTG
jgi:hypothetical protein